MTVVLPVPVLLQGYEMRGRRAAPTMVICNHQPLKNKSLALDTVQTTWGIHCPRPSSIIGWYLPSCSLVYQGQKVCPQSHGHVLRDQNAQDETRMLSMKVANRVPFSRGGAEGWSYDSSGGCWQIPP